MHLEEKARDIILTDRRFALKLRRHLNKEEGSISRPVREMWKEQSEAITVKSMRKALEIGTVTDEWKELWERKTREFVRDTV
ncbi:MAG: hypothetical protein KAW19_02320, partial [Candidatus Aminicenantes bacterium]|nr:hypothetical protein [Candidatus Aminicenantes bacterium]